MSTEPEPVVAAEGAPAPEAAGTPPAAEPTAEELRAQLAEVSRQKEQLLTEKTNSERRNEELAALREENERLRGGYSTPPTPHASDTSRLETFNQGINMWREAAQKGDPSAVAFLEVVGMLDAIPREFGQRLALTEIPGEERKEVERIIAEARNRGETISPATARQLRASAQLQSREQAIAAREAAIKRAEEDRANGVVATHRTPAAPRPAGNGTMTYSEYGREFEKATPERQDELRRQKRDGAIKLIPG